MIVPTISRCPSSSVPKEEQQRRKNSESLYSFAFPGLESVENANVRNGGWLLSFEQDYHHRASDKRYHVDVLAALPEARA